MSLPENDVSQSLLATAVGVISKSVLFASLSHCSDMYYFFNNNIEIDSYLHVYYAAVSGSVESEMLLKVIARVATAIPYFV